MKSLLCLISAAALLATAGCATRNDARGGYNGQPEYQTGSEEYPSVPDQEPDAWSDQKFPHVQHF